MKQKESIKMGKKAYLISCFNYYDNRLKFWEAYLEDKEWDVSYITTDFDHISKTKYKINRNNVVQMNTLKYKKNISFFRIFSHILFAIKVYSYLRKKEKNLVYVMIPPNMLLFFLAKLKKRDSFILVGDIYDMWPETFPVKEQWFLKIPFSLWKNFRNKSFKQIDYIITECNLYQKLLFKELNKTPKKTLYLTKDQKTKELILKKKTDFLDICYLGSINNIIDIDLIVDFLFEVNKTKKIVLHIIGNGENKDVFLKKLTDKKVKHYYYGAIFKENEKNKILSKCDFGLNIMKEEVTVGLTMKSMDYFAYSVPIINNITGDTRDLVNDYNIGYNLSKSSIKKIASEVSVLESNEIYNLKQNVKKMHKKLFSNESFEKNIDSIYKEIFKEKKEIEDDKEL